MLVALFSDGLRLLPQPHSSCHCGYGTAKALCSIALANPVCELLVPDPGICDLVALYLLRFTECVGHLVHVTNERSAITAQRSQLCPDSCIERCQNEMGSTGYLFSTEYRS